MKIVKGKYIRLTEEELKELISEEVNKRISILLEYAKTRKDFVSSVASLGYQIVENWCLIHYCTLIGRTETKTHWKGELYTHMNNIGRDNIKKNNSYETRLNAILEGFDADDLFISPEHVLYIIRRKFRKENIDVNDKMVLQTCVDCFNELKTIAHHIANFYNEDINDYINEI